jgi:hypothetical protein
MAGYGAGAGLSQAVTPGGYATANAVALSTTSPVTTAVALGTQGYTNGLIRVKIYHGGGTSPTVELQITVTDGTNTYTVLLPTTAFAVPAGANSGIDIVVDVNVDIEIATVDIITTLGGTTPTASMDYEIDLNP